jgi:hypothetical protein
MHDGEGRARREHGGRGGPAIHRRCLDREIPPGAAECQFELTHEQVVVDGSGDRDDEVLRAIVRPVVRPDGFARRRSDRLGSSADGPTERVVAEHGLEESFVRDIRRIVARHREFLEDDAALVVELDGIEKG